MHRADYWIKEKDGVRCQLCPQQCHIVEEQVGQCGVRGVKKGILWALAYGQVSASGLDPIEKKPLFHVKPGQLIYSIGSAGCNLKCGFCQNWNISQKIPPMNAISPKQVVAQAVQANACGIAYTYNEPLINIEFVLACAQAGRDQGLLNVMVTNGYVHSEPLNDLLPWIDAWNIDIKSMQDDFYKRNCAGRLAPVLETIQKTASCSHVELTHLMVTGENDAEDQVEALVAWVAGVSSEIPLHITRYFPQYKADQPPTDIEKLVQAKAIAEKKLQWVYLGNMRSTDDTTLCPDCGSVLVARDGYHARNVGISSGHCAHCARHVPGIF